jgi:transcriptional regulator PpsR
VSQASEKLVFLDVTPFSSPKKSLGNMNAEMIAKIISAAADVALVVDNNGIVKDVTFGSADLSPAQFGSWIGRRWIDTVTQDSRHKISALIEEASPANPSVWRHVNHVQSANGGELPIRYSTLRVKSDGSILAFGRDLRAVASLQQQLLDAQVAIERDYARLRQTELRYRLIFQNASEALIIADALTGRITEINPAALTLFGGPSRRLPSQTLIDLFQPADTSQLLDLFATLRATGTAESVTIEVPGANHPYRLSASLFRQGNQSFILARLSSPELNTTKAEDFPVLRSIVDKLPDGFAVTDLKGVILTANSAFLDLVELASEEQARDQPIDNWLGRSGVEVGVLISALKEHGSVRNFSTVVRGAYGSEEDVDVSAVSVMTGELPCFGFVVRPVTHPHISAKAESFPRSVENLKELVGRVALKDLVRETSDMIEKLCIEAALKLTGDNRASAAEMLGLSRQSLYVKMRRYGLGDIDKDASN